MYAAKNIYLNVSDLDSYKEVSESFLKKTGKTSEINVAYRHSGKFIARDQYSFNVIVDCLKKNLYAFETKRLQIFVKISCYDGFKLLKTIIAKKIKHKSVVYELKYLSHAVFFVKTLLEEEEVRRFIDSMRYRDFDKSYLYC